MNNWEEELKKILSGLDKIPDDGTLEEMDEEMQKVYAVCSKLQKLFIEEKYTPFDALRPLLILVSRIVCLTPVPHEMIDSFAKSAHMTISILLEKEDD